jgi:hypothetical protein
MAIDTLSNVLAALGLGSPADEADQISALLEPVTDAIEQYVGRQFESATFTEDYFGGEQEIALAQFPVTSITSVTDRVTGEVIDSSGYEVDANTGMLRRLPLGSQWGEARHSQALPLKENTPSRRWRVVYVAGSTPEGIKLAFYSALNFQIKASGGVFQSEKDGDYAYVKGAASSASSTVLPAEVMATLDMYRAGGFI